MQEIEARGGFRKAQAEGTIAQALERSLTAREQAVAARKRVLVGTNQFADPADRALDRVDEQRMKRRPARSADLRGVASAHRAPCSCGRKMPRVLLAEIGDAKMRAARSNFAANFFCLCGIREPRPGASRKPKKLRLRMQI